MMIIDFAKLRPGGNDTAIVRTCVAPELRASVARSLICSTYAGVEQVGYLEESENTMFDGKVEMMGGELCVNALRSAAALIATERGYGGKVSLSSSGSSDLLNCFVQMTGSSLYVTLEILSSLAVEILDPDTALVDFGGIIHFVLNSKVNVLLDPSKIFMDLRNRYAQRIKAAPACGLIVVSETNNLRSIQPLVYVRDTDSLILETACGSGSIAAAVIERMQGGSRYVSLLQPSGTLFDLDIQQMAGIWIIKIGSPVMLLLSGQAYLQDPIL